jgi:hypothetical protein
MSNYSFWRNLEAQFRMFPVLCADRQYVVGSHDEGGWRLSGASDCVCVKFDHLAKRAASRADREAPDLLGAWLKILKQKTIHSYSWRFIPELNDDGTKGPCYLLERIVNVCDLSANECSLRASAAREVEWGLDAGSRSENGPKHKERSSPEASSPVMLTRPDALCRAKPGPKRGIETACQVQEIVKQVTNQPQWRPLLDDICEALDEKRIPCPKTWKAREIECWSDASATERWLAKNAIAHHLENAKHKL